MRVSALRGDGVGVIHERGQPLAQTLGKFFGTLRNEIAKEVDFEA
jgi:hypothetical protein